MNKTILPIIFIIISLCFPYLVTADSNIEVTIETNPTIVSPGNQGYISLILKNIGTDEIQEIDVTLESKDWRINPENEWDIDVGGISIGNSMTLMFFFKVHSSAPAGLYEIEFEVRTLNAGYVSRSAIVTVEDSSLLDIINVEPDVLNIGEVTEMTFTIANKGQDIFNNILMYWEDTDNYILPSGSDNRLTISTIEPQNTTEISFKVIVNPALVPGVYPIFITLEYYDKTSTKQTISSEVGLQIGGGTNFDIILQESTAGITTFAIANTGSNTASSVIVSIPIQPNFSLNGASSVSLGNLDAGDYTLATFQISSVTHNNTQDSMTKPSDFDPAQFNFSNRPNFNNQNFTNVGGNNLLIDVSYTDLYGNRQTIQKEVSITSMASSAMGGTTYPFGRTGGQMPGNMPGSGTGFFDNGTTYIIIGIVGIIILIAIIKFDKIRKFPEVIKSKKGRKNENQ